MSIELPDWLRGTLLLGRDGAGNIIPILIDAAGQINVLLRGEDALGNVRTVRTDNIGQLYAILRGAGGNDVAVDAAGNMSAILKGLYGGVYTPLSVDADGRIEAFLLDGENQWGIVTKMGHAESASRLNPVMSYDWRGNVGYWTDFSQGIPSGFITLSGVGAAVVLSPEYWLNGGYSLKLTGGSNASQYARWTIRVPNTGTYRWGLACEFSTSPTIDSFDIGLTIEFAGWYKTFGLRIARAAGTLQYLNPAGAWVDFAPVVFTPNPGTFLRLKMVVNAWTGAYIRGLFNNQGFDLAAVSGDSAVATGLPYASMVLTAISPATFNEPVYVDNVIVTTNEPPNP